MKINSLKFRELLLIRKCFRRDNMMLHDVMHAVLHFKMMISLKHNIK